MQGTVICHHGVKGQKWGVRRFQNKDGTLTNAGKNRASNREIRKDKKALEKELTEKEYKKHDFTELERIKDLYADDYYRANDKATHELAAPANESNADNIKRTNKICKLAGFDVNKEYKNLGYPDAKTLMDDILEYGADEELFHKAVVVRAEQISPKAKAYIKAYNLIENTRSTIRSTVATESSKTLINKYGKERIDDFEKSENRRFAALGALFVVTLPISLPIAMGTIAVEGRRERKKMEHLKKEATNARNSTT